MMGGGGGAASLQGLPTAAGKKREAAQSKLFGMGCTGPGTAAAHGINIAGLLFKGMSRPYYANSLL